MMAASKYRLRNPYSGYNHAIKVENPKLVKGINKIRSMHASLLKDMLI